MSMELIQRVASLTVDGALCPGLARVRDAREQRKTCCLSVALTEGAAAAFTQPSHLISSHINHLLSALTFPITIVSHAIIVAILAAIADTRNVNTKSGLLLRTPHRLHFWRTVIANAQAQQHQMPLVSLEQCHH